VPCAKMVRKKKKSLFWFEDWAELARGKGKEGCEGGKLGAFLRTEGISTEAQERQSVVKTWEAERKTKGSGLKGLIVSQGRLSRGQKKGQRLTHFNSWAVVWDEVKKWY